MYESSHPRRASSYPFTRRAPFVAIAFPSLTITDKVVQCDDTNTSSRSFTPLKAVGDGNFSTVWLCDWHGALLPGTPIPAMQSTPASRPEYADKRLVAVKRIKRQWEGGWSECTRLKELIALREIPIHPNIVPLYDCFLVPETNELFFVFEPMEGNLYQLMKYRKGRTLAGGLVASIFRQTVSGLNHIHTSGFFHRDLKPENILVTTTGLREYSSTSPGGPPERDVEVVIKITDFGLARKTTSRPPYTEYVSVRWYRAPEVLLKSRDYSSPVDMWALGVIMAELLNLTPLFPGKSELDQMYKIAAILGSPSDEHVVDAPSAVLGGGKWIHGRRLAHGLGFQFPQTPPMDISTLFDRSVPRQLVQCLADLLRYDPTARLTSAQCIEHEYLWEVTAHATLTPTLPVVSTVLPPAPALLSASSRAPPPPPTCGPYPDLHVRRLLYQTDNAPPQLKKGSNSCSSASSHESLASTKVQGEEAMHVHEDAQTLLKTRPWWKRWWRSVGRWALALLTLGALGGARKRGDIDAGGIL